MPVTTACAGDRTGEHVCSRCVLSVCALGACVHACVLCLVVCDYVVANNPMASLICCFCLRLLVSK